MVRSFRIAPLRYYCFIHCMGGICLSNLAGTVWDSPNSSQIGVIEALHAERLQDSRLAAVAALLPTRRDNETGASRRGPAQ